jgi:hypothetical protein
MSPWSAILTVMLCCIGFARCVQDIFGPFIPANPDDLGMGDDL